MGSSVILPTAGQPRTGPDPSFRSAAIPNVVSFGFQGIDPPASVYIQRDDVLVIQGYSQNINEVVTVFYRILTPIQPQAGQPDALPGPPADPRGFIGPGYIQTGSFQLSIPVQRTLSSVSIPLMEGYLLSVGAVTSGAQFRGVTFVRVFINRGNFVVTAPNVAQMLFADYVTRTGASGWPAGRAVSSTEGPGALVTYLPGNPGVGTDLSFTTNVSGRERLGSFSATFTASAAPANRIVSFRVTGVGQYDVQDTVAVTASQVVRYSLGSGATNVRGAGAATAANPLDVTLPIPSPTYGGNALTVVSITQSIQAGDQWSAIQAFTEEWFDLL